MWTKIIQLMVQINQLMIKIKRRQHKILLKKIKSVLPVEVQLQEIIVWHAIIPKVHAHAKLNNQLHKSKLS